MAEASRARGVIKFLVWTSIATGLVVYFWMQYYNGTLVKQYYFKAKTNGWAVDVDTFKGASKEKPATLKIGSFETIDGLQAVPVKKGDRLPTNTNGIIDKKTVQAGKRVVLEGDTLKVLVPTQIKEAKGFKFRDTFKHKGIETDPWGGVWAVAFIFCLGMSLGLMAEGFTDMCGLKLQKIKHYEGAH